MRPTRGMMNTTEEPGAADGAEEEHINDPLTRADVECRELPSAPSSPLPATSVLCRRTRPRSVAIDEAAAPAVAVTCTD